MQTGVTRMTLCFVNSLTVFLTVGQMREGTEKFLVEIESLVENKTTSPEQILFLGVVLQAMLDATKPENNRESGESKTARDAAKAWFFASVGVTAEDFSTVCDIAGVDADYVRSFAFKVLKSKEIKYVRRRINAVLTFDQGKTNGQRHRDC